MRTPPQGKLCLYLGSSACSQRPWCWGVAPTHLSWGEPQNRSVADYLFSVGNTPFGPLAIAAGPMLAFPQVRPARYCSPRHMMPFNLKKRGLTMRWMTWRAMPGAGRPYPAADAVKRHVILSQVNATLHAARRVLSQVDRIADGEGVLSPEDHAEYSGQGAHRPT